MEETLSKFEMYQSEILPGCLGTLGIFLDTNKLLKFHLMKLLKYFVFFCFQKPVITMERQGSVSTVVPLPPHCGGGMALATTYAMLVASTTE